MQSNDNHAAVQEAISYLESITGRTGFRSYEAPKKFHRGPKIRHMHLGRMAEKFTRDSNWFGRMTGTGFTATLPVTHLFTQEGIKATASLKRLHRQCRNKINQLAGGYTNGIA